MEGNVELTCFLLTIRSLLLKRGNERVLESGKQWPGGLQRFVAADNFQFHGPKIKKQCLSQAHLVTYWSCRYLLKSKLTKGVIRTLLFNMFLFSWISQKKSAVFQNESPQHWCLFSDNGGLQFWNDCLLMPSALQKWCCYNSLIVITEYFEMLVCSKFGKIINKHSQISGSYLHKK